MHFILWFIVFATIGIYVCVIMSAHLWILYMWICYKCITIECITKVYGRFYASEIRCINVIGEWLTFCFLYVMLLYIIWIYYNIELLL